MFRRKLVGGESGCVPGTSHCGSCTCAFHVPQIVHKVAAARLEEFNLPQREDYTFAGRKAQRPADEEYQNYAPQRPQSSGPGELRSGLRARNSVKEALNIRASQESEVPPPPSTVSIHFLMNEKNLESPSSRVGSTAQASAVDPETIRLPEISISKEDLSYHGNLLMSGEAHHLQELLWRLTQSSHTHSQKLELILKQQRAMEEELETKLGENQALKQKILALEQRLSETESQLLQVSIPQQESSSLQKPKTVLETSTEVINNKIEDLFDQMTNLRQGFDNLSHEISLRVSPQPPSAEKPPIGANEERLFIETIRKINENLGKSGSKGSFPKFSSGEVLDLLPIPRDRSMTFGRFSQLPNSHRSSQLDNSSKDPTAAEGAPDSERLQLTDSVSDKLAVRLLGAVSEIERLKKSSGRISG